MNAAVQGSMTTLHAAHAVRGAKGNAAGESLSCSRQMEHSRFRSRTGAIVEREDGAVRAENISTDEEGKREALHNEQGMVHRDAGDFNGRVDVAAYLSAGASNADDVRCCASEWLNHGSVA